MRDAVVEVLQRRPGGASVGELHREVSAWLGGVSRSSVQSSLQLNVPDRFVRERRGVYRLTEPGSGDAGASDAPPESFPSHTVGRATVFHADCLDWLRSRPEKSVQAVVTDPPYGIIEFSNREKQKLRDRSGGVWRQPPSFDGNKRSPLPRFTVLTDLDRETLRLFFVDWARELTRVLVPGANVVVAANPLLSHIVGVALAEGGLERRGEIVRLTMTMRGGDRPKNAHEEFEGVSVMPRSMWEPWVAFRRPLEGRVQDNLRRWRTGGFRRISDEQPFGDVIKSGPTRRIEKALSGHPSLKPQSFLRKLVRASLPLGEGVVLDPFSGSGSTLAAAEHCGYESVGIEKDASFFDASKASIPALAALDRESSLFQASA